MTSYSYRRKLTRDELVPALAAGVGLGLGVAAVTAYLTQMFLRRTPLRSEDAERKPGSMEDARSPRQPPVAP